MQLDKKTLKNGNPRGDPNNAPRCLAKTRKGTPCQAPRVRGKKRCRMHGAFAGRPKDPRVQMNKYIRLVNNHISKFCMNCKSINMDCRKIHLGKILPEDFKRRVQKYCQVVDRTHLSDVISA